MISFLLVAAGRVPALSSIYCDDRWQIYACGTSFLHGYRMKPVAYNLWGSHDCATNCELPLRKVRVAKE
jgi:hypothetical protein